MRISAIVASVLLSFAAVGCGVGKSELESGIGGDDGNGGGSSGSSGNSGKGGEIITIDGGSVTNPCETQDAGPDCMLEPSGPACGDGKLNQDNEACDDGNPLPGDGCTGTCVIEPDYVCEVPGEPCVSTIVCGDGVVGRGEACDDTNTADGDGCSANCRQVERGWVCRTPGAPCTEVHLCGDARTDSNEGCDDGGIVEGDGCDARCRVELGWKCSGSPSTCTATTCGDNIQEGAESCDDGNTLGFDGCAPDCRAEPECTAGTGSAPLPACSSSCGDGIVLDEQCDDGNGRDGDGCSSTCMVEDGFECDNDPPCEAVNGVCSFTVPAIYRDFNANQSAGGHPDFQPGYNSEGVKGAVSTYLNAQGKPTLTAAATTANGFFHGAGPFAQWYTNAQGVNAAVPSTIRLWQNATGGYVNRWGAMGEPWRGYPRGTINGVMYPEPQACSNTDCTACAMPPPETLNGIAAPPGTTIECLDDCLPWGDNTQACYAVVADYDGNPLFFPLDPPTPGIMTDARLAACTGGMSACSGKVPEQYGWGGWPWESEVATRLGITVPVATSTAPFPSATHNFHFTTEVKYWFRYDAATTATLEFTGDDDVWVFLNGRLAVDLGGWHVPLNGSLTMTGGMVATSSDTGVTTPPLTSTNPASAYGLEDGNVYQIAVFHAERQIEGSSFKLTLAGFNRAPSDCRTNCGDGMLGVGEECDDCAELSADMTSCVTPAPRGGYNQCTADCRIGPRCGDAVVQTDAGEACDDGINAGDYGVGCGPNCQPSPFCGDGIVQPEFEACDDGTNELTYGGCAPGCVLGPYCGNGRIEVGFEECDDGNYTNMDGCSSACRLEIVTR